MFFSDFFFNLQIENVIERKNAKNATKPGTPRLKWLKSRLAMSVCLIHLWLEKYNCTSTRGALRRKQAKLIS